MTQAGLRRRPRELRSPVTPPNVTDSSFVILDADLSLSVTDDDTFGVMTTRLAPGLYKAYHWQHMVSRGSHS